MKKVFLLFSMMVATMSMLAQGEIEFRWENAESIDYRASDTLRVECDDLTSFSCSFSLANPAMSKYVRLQGDVVTVLNCYNQGTSTEDYGKIFINARITNMVPAHADTVITGFIRTNKISPNLRWTCQLGDMMCGEKVQLTSAHDNTDSIVFITYEAEDYHSQQSTYVDIDINDVMTALSVGRGIFTTVTIGETNNFVKEKVMYPNNDTLIRFDVLKGYRPITWNSDFGSLTNLSEGIELHTKYLENHDTVWYSSSDSTIADIVGGNYLKVVSPGRVTVTALVKESNNYYESRSDTIIDIPIANTTIYWEENVIEGQKPKINSTAKNYNLKVFAGSNYVEGTSYHFSVSDTSIAKVTGDTLLTCYKMGSFELSAYADNDIGGQSPVIRRDVDVTRGFMRFVKDGKWNDRSSWERSDLEPSRDDYNVEMLAKCTIPDGTTAECHDMKIFTQGGIVVMAEATLYVENRLENNAGEEQLVLKADKKKQATVYFREGNPLATVEVWMEMSSTNGKDTVWEYKGVPMDTAYLRNRNGKQVVYEHSEEKGWKNISSMMPMLTAWKGYKMTDTLPCYYSFEGRLNAGKDYRYELGYSEYKKKDAGMNLVANCFAAPVDIRAIEFEGVLDEMHYPIGKQWACAPKYTAAAIGNRGVMMPSDAMFVQAASMGASVTIDYEKAMMNAFEEENFNVLKVAISGAKYSDTVVLVGYANGTGGFENGYDGTKWLGPDTMPQIYATADWGRASVNAEQSIVGQSIGVIAANDADLYRITFDTKRLKGYDQLYLFDMRTQAYVDIIAGEPYSFTTTRLGEDKRFTIMRDKIEAKKDKNGHGFVVAGNRVLLVGFGDEHSMVRVMNAAGVIVYEFWSDEGPWVELPPLLNGIYIISSGESHTKFYR